MRKPDRPDALSVLAVAVIVAALGVAAMAWAAPTPQAPDAHPLSLDLEGVEVYVADAADAQVQIMTQADSCLSLASPSGERTLTVPGPILYDASGQIVWSADQLTALGRAGAFAGADDSGLFSLRAGPDPFGDGPTPFPGRDTEINPECGQCLSGLSCVIYPNKSTCCLGRGFCTRCRTCADAGKPKLATQHN